MLRCRLLLLSAATAAVCCRLSAESDQWNRNQEGYEYESSDLTVNNEAPIMKAEDDCALRPATGAAILLRHGARAAGKKQIPNYSATKLERLSRATQPTQPNCLATRQTTSTDSLPLCPNHFHPNQGLNFPRLSAIITAYYYIYVSSAWNYPYPLQNIPDESLPTGVTFCEPTGEVAGSLVVGTNDLCAVPAV
jgi:hypothetical protein